MGGGGVVQEAGWGSVTVADLWGRFVKNQRSRLTVCESNNNN
jgi:hypothetical protein